MWPSPRCLPKAVLDFVEGGAEDELTIEWNRQALQAVCFVPRVLADVSRRSQSATLLDTPVSSPVVLAPIGLAALVHPAWRSPPRRPPPQALSPR